MDQNDIPANDKRKSLLTRIEEGLRRLAGALYGPGASSPGMRPPALRRPDGCWRIRGSGEPSSSGPAS